LPGERRAIPTILGRRGLAGVCFAWRVGDRSMTGTCSGREHRIANGDESDVLTHA
jgi:hypothetical protein